MSNTVSKNKISKRDACLQIILTLRYSWLNIIVFELIYKILVLIIYNPFVGFATSMFSKSGEPITNFIGLILILILIPLSAVLIYYEFALLYVFLYAGSKKLEIKFLLGLKTGIASLQSLHHISSIGFLFYALCLIPLLKIGIHSSILPAILIPEFITGEIVKYPGGMMLLGLIMYIPIVIFMILVFVLPIMSLERLNFDASLKRNFYLLKGNLLNTVIILLATFICWCLPMIILYSINSTAPLLFSSAGILIDSLQIISTPLLLSAILICFKQNAEINIFDEKDNKNIVQYKPLKCIWDKYMPKIIKKRSSILLLLLVIPVYINTFNYYSIRNEVKNACLIIGHRGSMAGVENTIPAVLAATKQKADYAEIDVLLSKDNVPVVIHDNNLFRLSGEMTTIQNLSAEKIEKIVLEQNDLEGKIPTLDQLCQAVKGNSKLLIELKSHGNESVSIVEQVVRVILENGMEGNCIFHTSERKLIEEMKEKYPEFTIGYVIVGNIKDVSDLLLDSLSADFLSAEYSIINKQLVESCHKAGKKIYGWTVNDKDSVLSLLNINIDGIITDYPEKVRQTVFDS